MSEDHLTAPAWRLADRVALQTVIKLSYGIIMAAAKPYKKPGLPFALSDSTHPMSLM
jgi:hypothetical protein